MKPTIKWMVGVGLVGLLLRLAVVFQFTPGNAIGPFDDDGDYFRIADAIVTEGIYVNDLGERAWRPPLFPLFLAGIFKVHGIHSFLVVRIYLTFVSMLLPIILAWFAHRMWGEKEALVAFCWATFHPAFVHYSAHVQNDAFFLVFSTMALMSIMLEKTPTQTFLSGLLSGLACLGRSQFAGGFLIGFLWTFWKFRPKVHFPLIFLFGFVLVMTPWWIRNYKVFHRFVPLSTEGGYTLWVGNNAETDGGGVTQYTRPENLPVGEIERDKRHYQEAFKYMRENPKRTLMLALSKESRFWGLMPRVGGPAKRLVSFVTYATLFGFSLYGIWLLRKQLDPWKPFLALCLYYTMTQSVFPSLMRYRMVLEPFFIVLASYAVTQIYRRRFHETASVC